MVAHCVLVLLLLLLGTRTRSTLGDEPAGEEGNEGGKIEGEVDAGLMNQQAYRSLFAAKRREQIETAEKILSLNDYAKQYKMIEMLGETVFSAMNNSKVKLDMLGYIAGTSSFPKDQEPLEAVGVIFEGIPFFGDVLLRLPDITKKVFKYHKKEWLSILKWGMEFCENTTAIFNGHHATQLQLMSQELGFVPEDPNYVNPFRNAHQEELLKDVKKEAKKKKNKKSKKGPKLRGHRTEL